MKSKEIVSARQGISIIILYVVSMASVFMFSLGAKKDFWLAIIIALFASFFVVLVLGRLKTIFPYKNYYEIVEEVFGAIIGKGIITLYAWFFFHTGVLILMNIVQFATTVSLIDTPQLPTAIFIIGLNCWMLKCGVETLGRWSSAFLLPVLILILLFVLLLIPDMDINNLKPILYDGIQPLMKGTFSIFTFPFGELVIFTIIFTALRKKNSFYKVLFLGNIIGFVFVFIISFSVVTVLGIERASSLYYPTYTTLQRINIAGVVQGLELVLTIAFVLAGFLKVCVYLLSSCLGIAKIFNYDDYRFLAVPVGLLALCFSVFLFPGTISFHDWSFALWPAYAISFQVLIPFTLYAVVEIKRGILKKKQAA